MGPARRTTLALAALVLALVPVAGCSQEEANRAIDEAQRSADNLELPSVDWDKIGRDTKREIDQLAAEADCEELKKELAKAEGNDTALTAYIKAQLRRADCT